MKEKLLTKDFVLIMLGSFFTGIIMYGLATTIAEYAGTLGAGSAMAGFAAGINTVGALATRLLSSGVMSRYRWKSLAIICHIFYMITCLLYLGAVNIPFLIIVRFLHGLAFGFSASLLITIGISLVPPGRTGEGSGVLMLGPALSMAIGPFFSVLVISHFGQKSGFIMSAICSVIVVILMLLADIDRADPKMAAGADRAGGDHTGEAKQAAGADQTGEAKQAAGARQLLERLIDLNAIPVSICILFMVISYSGFISFMRPFGHAEGLDTTFIFLIYAFIVLFTRPASGKVQDRLGDAAVVYPGIILQAALVALMALRPSPLTMVLAVFGLAMGYGNLCSCLQAIAVRRTSAKRRPYAINTFWVFCDGGMAIGPMILGAVASSGGYRTMFIAASVITIAALPLYMIVSRRRM